MYYDDTLKQIRCLERQPLPDEYFDKASRIKELLILLDIARTIDGIYETYAEADARDNQGCV